MTRQVSPSRAPRAPASDTTGDRMALRLLCTTDLHGHVLPWDYIAGRRDRAIGLSQIAMMVRAHRRHAANTLLFDNGDFLQGNPMADAETARLGRGGAGPHAVIAAMNALGFDAGTLGNHEFEAGLASLRRSLAEAAHPLTSANLRAAQGPPLVAPGLLLHRRLRAANGAARTIRIGVIGLAPPQAVEWTARHSGDRVTARDMVGAARGRAGALRRLGADIVVALAHTGLGPERIGARAENAGRALAALPGIDALFLGHTHEVYPDEPARGLLHGTPVAQAGRHGSHLGVIDLDLARDAAGGWHVRHGAARVEPTDRAPLRAPACVAPLRRPHIRARRLLRREIGRSALPISSHFALVSTDPSLQLLADAWARAARRMLDGRPEAALPLLVATSPFRAGGQGGGPAFLSIEAGPLTERDLRALQPHADALCLSRIDGRMLRHWLERSAALFRRLLPGRRDQPLIDPRVPPYRFDVIHGLRWRIDPSRPPGARIEDLRHAGRPVGPDDSFVVAVTSHRLGGADPLAEALRAGRLPIAMPPLHAVLRTHLAAGPVAPRPRPSWRFAALPGTRAWFDAPPEARGAAAPGIAALGPAATGLHRFELRLGHGTAARPIDTSPRLGYVGPARTRTPRCPAAMTP